MRGAHFLFMGLELVADYSSKSVMHGRVTTYFEVLRVRLQIRFQQELPDATGGLMIYLYVPQSDGNGMLSSYPSHNAYPIFQLKIVLD